jgi:TonB family protein
MGKPLYLRGFWADDKLKFGPDGQPEKAYKTTSFTMSGFDPTTIRVDGDILKLTGNRVVLMFDDPKNPKRGVMRVSENKNAKPEQINISLARGGDGTFAHALDATFADGLAELTPSLPDYWQIYAQTYFLPHTASNDSADDELDRKHFASVARADGKIIHIGGAVHPPQIVYSAPPEFPDSARRQKTSGTVQVYFWLGEDGLPSHIRIARAMGMGLDEAAIAAVEQYRFKPATLNGKPVKVDLYIEVNFQIF